MYIQGRYRAVARTLIGGCIFIYSVSARVASFEINFIPEYMNIHPPPPPPINALATALFRYVDDIVRDIKRHSIEDKVLEINELHPSLKFADECETKAGFPLANIFARSDFFLLSQPN